MPVSSPVCSICGGTTFIASLAGRIAKNGQPPKCASCGGLERHRIVRRIFDALPDELLNEKNALQFSDDPGVPKDRLGQIDISVFGSDNSLNIMDIARPNSHYDWAIANHVLEHVADDISALKELLRIIKPDGLVQFTVPTPSSQLWTEDWGYADPEAYEHFRGYGSDLPLRLGAAIEDAGGVQVIGWDTVITARWDVVYFFSPSRERISELATILRKAGFPVLAATR
ncbi:MAG: methyltransferase domain-containing protein [Stappiaceae bacterium]